MEKKLIKKHKPKLNVRFNLKKPSGKQVGLSFGTLQLIKDTAATHIRFRYSDFKRIVEFLIETGIKSIQRSEARKRKQAKRGHTTKSK